MITYKVTLPSGFLCEFKVSKEGIEYIQEWISCHTGKLQVIHNQHIKSYFRHVAADIYNKVAPSTQDKDIIIALSTKDEFDTLPLDGSYGIWFTSYKRITVDPINFAVYLTTNPTDEAELSRLIKQCDTQLSGE